MREFKNISSDLNEQVPKDWKVTKLNLVANLRRGPFGGALKVDSFVPEGYAVYEQQHAIHKKLSNIRYFINENKYNEMLAFKVEANDILLSCSGTIGESVIIPIDYKEGIINQALLRIRLFREDLNINYFKYYMDSFLFQTLITDNSHGSAMKNIASMNVINKIPVPVPSESEQEKIVLMLNSKLRVLDQTIEMKYKVLELLEQQRQSIITEAVTKGLNPNVKMKDSGVEWIGEIPEHWNLTKIKYVAALLNGDRGENYPSGNDFVDEGIPFVTSHNLNNRYVDNLNMKYITKERYNLLRGIKIKKNDIIYCLRGSVGKNALLTNDEGTIASSLMGIRANTKINAEFLSYILNSKMEVWNRSMLTTGSVSDNLSAENVGTYLFTFPDLVEQLEIVDYLNNEMLKLEELIMIVSQQIEKFKEYRQSLIYEAVTGKIDVRELELD